MEPNGREPAGMFSTPRNCEQTARMEPVADFQPGVGSRRALRDLEVRCDL
jgi:hypothetical protein